MKLPLIPLDKANHLIYGFAIYFASNLVVNEYYALAIAILFALGKELRDQKVYKGFDIKDFLVTIVAPLLMFLKAILL